MQVLSGEHFRIEYQDLRATVSSVGATLREFSRDSVPILWGRDLDSLPVGSSGQVLAPWPNRLAAGRYVFNGAAGKAPLDEPDRGNAIHGLVRWLEWKLEYQERARVKLTCALAPQPAYPFLLSLALIYELGPNGLTVRVQAESPAGAPFGIGFHPYFLAAVQGLAGSRLVVPATQHLELDANGIPTGVVALDSALAPLATNEGIELEGRVLDDCFTGLARDDTGTATVRFLPGGGPISEVALRLDRHFGYVMCFTGDTLDPASRRRAVAIEPMTCPPNAFASGTDVVGLDQHTTLDAAFSISVT